MSYIYECILLIQCGTEVPSVAELQLGICQLSAHILQFC